MLIILLTNVYALLGYACYSIWLKDLTFFQWNRVFLLSIFPIAFLLALVSLLDVRQVSSSLLFTALLEPVIIGGRLPNSTLFTLFESALDLNSLLITLYGVGFLFALVGSVKRFLHVRRLLNQQHSTVAYSFFNKINLGEHSEASDTICKHEAMHRLQYHSWDLVFMEVIRTINWFNPWVVFLIADLKLQHELFVDRYCAAENPKDYATLLLAQSLQVSPSTLMNEFVSENNLKTRIMMLFKERNGTSSVWKYGLIVPLIVVCLGSSVAFQETKPSSKKQASAPVQEMGNEVFTMVEGPPQPHGGMGEFMKFVGANFNVTAEMIAASVNGTIEVKFVVEKDGSMSNFEIVNDLGHRTGEEAIALLKKYPHKWKAGIQNARKVRVAYLLPIKLNLSKSKS